MSTTSWNRERRARLFKKQRGLCYYCGVRMVQVDRRGQQMKAGTRDPRECTLEHLIDRNDPFRGRIKGKLVAACHKCNHTRGAERQRQFDAGREVAA